MRLILSDNREFEETAYLSKITLITVVFLMKCSSSVIVTEGNGAVTFCGSHKVDTNLWSFSSVVLIKGQLEMYGNVFGCHSDLENS